MYVCAAPVEVRRGYQIPLELEQQNIVRCQVNARN